MNLNFGKRPTVLSLIQEINMSMSVDHSERYPQGAQPREADDPVITASEEITTRRAQVNSSVMAKVEISSKVVDEIAMAFYEMQIEAVKRLLLPLDFEQQGFLTNRSYLFRWLLEERFPEILARVKEDEEFKSYLLRQCGLPSNLKIPR